MPPCGLSDAVERSVQCEENVMKLWKNSEGGDRWREQVGRLWGGVGGWVGAVP